MVAFRKISDTSTRVLETLKFLSQHKASIQDIIRYFELKDPNNRVYTNEVILKYINTLKVFGYKFKKEKDKYVMLNTPIQFEFDEKDLKAIWLMKNFSQMLPEEKIKNEAHKFLQDLERRFSEQTKLLAQGFITPQNLNLEDIYTRFSSKISVYEQYCMDRQKLKITYEDRHESNISVTVEPNEIKYKGSDVYFRVYNPLSAEIQDINFESIIEIKQLPQKSNAINMHSSVTFKLKDRLAKAYRLHDGEKLLKLEDDGSIVILNQQEDRILLLKRLMRYGENCELISPKRLRADMINMITSTLNNYC